MDEEKKEEKKEEPKLPPKDTDGGSKYETTPVIERAREERERMEKVKDELKIENDRRERIQARDALGGSSEAGIKSEEPKKLTDQEYAEALEKGEVNPLKEDGFIK